MMQRHTEREEEEEEQMKESNIGKDMLFFPMVCMKMYKIMYFNEGQVAPQGANNPERKSMEKS